MARIKSNEVIDDNLFQKQIENAKKLEKVWNDLIETQRELFAQSKKGIEAIQLDKKRADSIRNILKGERELIQNKKALEQLEKQQTTTKRELVKLEVEEERRKQAKLRTEVQERKEKERLEKLEEREAKRKQQLNSIYARESKRLNDLRRRYKDLVLAEGGATRATKKLRLEIQNLDSKLKRVDAEVGQFQRNVGNYRGAIAGSLGTVGQFATGAGAIAAGIQLAGRAISSAIDIIKEFEQANANLGAILGATAEEMEVLSNQAKQLGASTAFSASQVTELQTELAKLGFTTDQITQVTESTLNAATALGSGLGEQAALTGAALRSFGLDASEAARVNDVLVKSTTASALDFSKLQTSLSTVAPVANAFGFSIEETTALLGQLSNAGFDASSAATATRNILLNLADSNGDLAKSLGGPVKNLPDLVKGLESLKAEGIDLATALELTDKRSVAAFATFLGGTDEVLKLNEALKGAGDDFGGIGTAAGIAQQQLDTLDGQLKILNSSWEGFVLSLEDGEGQLNTVAKLIVEDLAKGLSIVAGESKEVRKEFSVFGTILTSINAGLQLVIASFRILTIPWQIIITLATELAQSFGIIDDSIGDITDSLEFLVQIFNNLPEIVKIISQEIAESFRRLGTIISGIVELIAAAAQRDVEKAKAAGVKVADAFAAGFGDIAQDIPNRIRALFADDENLLPLQEEAEKAGKKTGKAFTDGVKSELFDLSDDEVLPKEVVTLEIEVDPFEEDELRKILAAARKQLDEFRDDQEKKEEEQRKKAFGIAAGFLDSLLQKIRRNNAERLQAIDDEIEASLNQQEELRKAAREGVRGAAEDLEVAEKQEREARLRKEQEIRKQKRQEAGLTFLKLLAAKAEAGDPNPFISASLDFAKTQAFIDSLPSKKEGDDNIGKTAKPLDSDGGRLIVAHDDEMIVDKKRADKMRGMGYDTRDKIIKGLELAENYKRNQLDKAHKELHVVNQYESNAQVLEKFEKLNQTIKDLPAKMPKNKVDYDPFLQAFIQEIKTGNLTERYIRHIGTKRNK